jgi:hypothetical protein
MFRILTAYQVAAAESIRGSLKPVKLDSEVILGCSNVVTAEGG